MGKVLLPLCRDHQKKLQRRYNNFVTEMCSECMKEEKEAVNHPDHYNSGKFEAIEVIEDWDMGFHCGNAIKYICRHNHKERPVEDIKKAIWYLERYLASLNEGK